MNKLDQVLNKYMPTKSQFIKNDFITSLDKLFRTEISKSEVMRRAHILFKKGIETFSEALKQSWKIEKSKIEENKLKISK